MEATVQPFLARMNKDLIGWTQRQKKIIQIIDDYKATLHFVNQSKKGDKIMVELGQGVFTKGKRITDKIVLKMKQDIYIQVDQKQAMKIIPNLLILYQQKLSSSRKQINKIMMSMRQVQDLLNKYSAISQ